MRQCSVSNCPIQILTDRFAGLTYQSVFGISMSGKIAPKPATAIDAGCNGEPLKILIAQIEIVDATMCVEVFIFRSHFHPTRVEKPYLGGLKQRGSF